MVDVDNKNNMSEKAWKPATAADCVATSNCVGSVRNSAEAITEYIVLGHALGRQAKVGQYLRILLAVDGRFEAFNVNF